MTYRDQDQRSNRPAVFTGVALLHVAAGYALVTGLGGSYIREVMPVFQARSYPADPPAPPPAPKPSASPEVRHTRLANRSEHLDLFPTAGPALGQIELPPIAPPIPPSSAGDDLIRVDPAPRPALGTAPRAARPHGSAAGWATTADYPARDLREGNQGLVRFSVVVGTDGRVQSCEITMSSGFPGLDKTTCDDVTRRARFDPATDASGNRAAGTYSGSVRWVIPQG